MCKKEDVGIEERINFIPDEKSFFMMRRFTTRRNEIGIQMLSKPLYDNIFPSHSKRKPPKSLVDLCEKLLLLTKDIWKPMASWEK
jgi:hypothetical protein